MIISTFICLVPSLFLLEPVRAGRFVEDSAVFHVSEAAPPGASIGRISLRDGYGYRVSRGHPAIAFDNTTGHLRLLDSLDREQTNGTIALLLVTSPPSLIHVSVVVDDVNDNAPTFPTPVYNTSMIESSPVGTTIILPSAVDSDDAENGTIAEYRIEEPGNEHFTIDGDPPLLFLRLAQPLDRETTDSHVLNISARDGGTHGLKGFMLVHIAVVDVNDNEPQFRMDNSERKWSGTIEEPIVEINVTDADLGENGRVKVRVEDPYGDIFYVDDAKKLNAKSPISCSPCVLRLEATDHGIPPLSSFTTLTIHQSAANAHDPKIHFRMNPPEADFILVGDDSPVGKVLAVVTVTDDDGPIDGVRDLRLEEDKTPENSAYFRLDKQGRFGLLRLAKAPPKDATLKFDLHFAVSDGQTPPRTGRATIAAFLGEKWRAASSHSSSSVSIPASIEVSIASDAPIGSLLHVVRSRPGTMFRLAHASECVELDAESGILTSRSSLANCSRAVELEVLKILPPPALEPVREIVHVKIIAPARSELVFIDLPEVVSIAESTIPGALILTLKAVDKETRSSDDVIYSVVDEEGLTSVERGTARLILKEKINHEKLAEFTIELNARKTNQTRAITKILRVIIQDENEFAPSFLCKEMHISLRTSHLSSAPLGRIPATDGDIGPSGIVSYSLMEDSANYGMDTVTGEFRVLLPRTDERTDVMHVTALDGAGRASDKNSTIYVHWTKGSSLSFVKGNDSLILDEDDLEAEATIDTYSTNDPISTLSLDGPFLVLSPTGELSLSSLPPPSVLRLPFTVTAKSGSKIASICGSIVIKRRPPQPKFKKDDIFITIDRSTPIGGPLMRASACHSPCHYTTDCSLLSVSDEGVFSLAAAPARGTDAWSCRVEALDEWGRNAIARVSLERSSHEIALLPAHWTLYISEEAPVGEEIGQLSGTSDGFLFTSSSTITDVGVFPDGRVLVRRPLDRERIREYTLPIEATHASDDTYRSTGLLRVIVLDVNDNAPSCEEGRVIKIPEDTAPGSIVGTLHSIDEDEGRNGTVAFRLTGRTDSFHVDIRTGEILLLRPLDAESESSFIVHYSVRDAGEPSLSNECSARIEVTDVNGFGPVCRGLDEIFVIDGERNEEVVALKCSDEDKEWNVMTYTLIDHGTMFKLDASRGRLSVCTQLPSRSSYRVKIRVLDNGPGPTRKTSIIHVYISVRDRAGESVSIIAPESMEVSAGTKVGSIIGHISAHIHEYSFVRFSVLNGPVDVDALGQLMLTQSLKQRTGAISATLQAASARDNATKTISIVPVESSEIAEMPTTAHVQENSPAGNAIARLPTGVRIAFEYPPGLIILDEDGRLKTAMMIDRETTPRISLLLSGPSSSLKSLLTVEIDDVNDVDPICGGVRAFVVRELPAIFPVACTDEDANENGTVRYRYLTDAKSRRSTEALELQVRPDGTIVVQSMESPTATIRVEAFDRPASSDAARRRTEFEVVLLKELPTSEDKLSLENANISLTVSADAQIGSIIGRVGAVSKGKQRARYFITHSSWSNLPIAVDEDSGQITLAAPLKRAGTATILALTESAMARAQISLTPMEGDTTEQETVVFSLWRKAPKGTVIGKLPGGKGAKFSTSPSSSSPFDVDASSGEVSLAGGLSSEVDVFTFNVTSARTKEPKETFTVHVVIVDQSPSSGKLTEPTLFVRENAPYGTIIGWAPDWVEGGGPWEPVSGGENPFKIDSAGLIIVSGELDFEKKTMYSLRVKDKSSGKETELKVFVEDENDHAPEWRFGDSVDFSVAEDATVGTVVGEIYWQDLDMTANLFSVRILSGNGRGAFAIDEDGLVRVETPLDREVKASYDLKIEVRDHTSPYRFHSLAGTVHITLIDVNDNAPKFTSPSLFFVSETTHPSTAFGTIKAVDTDKGGNGTVRYRILPESLPHGEISIDPLLGYLIVNKELDYEAREEYAFTVEAEDGGLPTRRTTMEITVRIIDEDDREPEEMDVPDMLSITERAAHGESLTSVRLIDVNRTGVAPGVFWLSPCSHSFTFDRGGNLVVAGPLDYETETTINVTLYGRTLSGGSPSVSKNITIAVDDENDEAPRFITGDNLIIHVSEAMQGPFPAIIGSSIAEDADEDSRLAYSLLEGNTSLFAIDSTTGDLSLLHSLDRETQPSHHLRVQASDSGTPRKTTMCSITIVVVDANDLVPTFALPLYEVHVAENSPPGRELLSLVATEGDEGENGRIRYSIVDPPTSPFSIDPDTGQLKTSGSIDRESKAEYELTIKAADSGRYTQHSSTARVRILVDDVKDNVPVILNTAFDVYLSEALGIGEVAWPVIAHDTDDSSSLTFALLPDADSPFGIDSATGVIRLAAPLTRQHYSVGVTVTDGGGLNTTASFSFYLEAARKFPRFVDEGLETMIKVREGDGGVLLTARAVGIESAPLSYSLLSPCTTSFIIDPSTGVVEHSGLSLHHKECLSLFVIASTTDSPPLSAILPVTIELEDVNDHAPRFEKLLYSASILENASPSSLVVVRAQDDDSADNAVVTYEIMEGNEGGLFEVDSETGEVRTREGLDRETASEHTLIIVARDRGRPPMEGRTTVKISVLDENDAPPRFTRLFMVSVREDVTVPHPLIVVEAVDPDTEGRLEYSLENDGNGTLSIDSKTGAVTLLKQIDREHLAVLRVGVFVSDDRWRVRTTLRVEVEDVNDNAPKFDSDVFIVWTDEVEQLGPVLNLSATDADAGDNAFIDYSIAGGDSLWARVSPTGEVFLEARPSECVEIPLLATDRGVPSLSSSARLLLLSSLCSFAPLRGGESGHHPILPLIETLADGDEMAQVDIPNGEEGEVAYTLAPKTRLVTLTSDGRILKSNGSLHGLEEVLVVARNGRGTIHNGMIVLSSWSGEVPRRILKKSYSIVLPSTSTGLPLARLHNCTLPLMTTSHLPGWLDITADGIVSLKESPPLEELPMKVELRFVVAGCTQCTHATVLDISAAPNIQSLPLISRTSFDFLAHRLDSTTGCLGLVHEGSINLTVPTDVPGVSLNATTGCLSWWGDASSTSFSVLATSPSAVQLARVNLRRLVPSGEVGLMSPSETTIRVPRTAVKGTIVQKISAIGTSVHFDVDSSSPLAIDGARGELAVAGGTLSDGDIDVFARSARVVEKAMFRLLTMEEDVHPTFHSSEYRVNGSDPSLPLPRDLLDTDVELPSGYSLLVGDGEESLCPHESIVRLCSLPPHSPSISSILITSPSNDVVSRATVILNVAPLMTTVKLPRLVGHLRENARPSTIMRIAPEAIVNATYRLDDEEMSNLFSIDSSGVLTSLGPLDRESRALYVVPVTVTYSMPPVASSTAASTSTSSPSRAKRQTLSTLFRVHIDDEADSAAMNRTTALEVFIVGNETRPIGPVHAPSRDVVPTGPCVEFADAFYEIDSACRLSLRAGVRPPTNHTLRPGSKEDIAVVREADRREGSLQKAVTVKVYAAPAAMAQLISGLRKEYEDMGVHPLGILMSETTDEDEWSIVLAMKDRNARPLAPNETESVIKSFLDKRKTNDIYLLSISPARRCPEKCPESCVISSTLIGEPFSLRGPRSLWSIPRIALKSRCPPDFGGISSLRSRPRCSSSSCNGNCIEDRCVCRTGWKGSECREDIDECAATPCPPTALCINTRGAYQCVCPGDAKCDVDAVKEKEEGVKITFSSNKSSARVFALTELSTLQTSVHAVNYTLMFELRTTSEFLPVLPPLLLVVNGRLRLAATNLSFPIANGEWHRVELRPHSIRVCRSSACPSTATSNSFAAPLPSLLSFALPRPSSSFSLCLRSPTLNGHALVPSTSTNVDSTCSVSAPCEGETACQGGTCLADTTSNTKCACDGGVDAAECGQVLTAISVSGGGVVFTPTDALKKLSNTDRISSSHYSFVDYPSEEIALDFRSTSDAATILSLEYAKERTTVEVRGGVVVLRLEPKDGGRPSELSFKKKVDDGEWHTLTLQLLGGGKTLRIHVGAEGKEVRAHAADIPRLLSVDLEKMILGRGSSVCFRRLTVNRQLQSLGEEMRALNSALFSVAWEGGVLASCPVADSWIASAFSAVFSWPVLLILCLLLASIVVGVLIVLRWQQFGGRKGSGSDEGHVNKGIDLRCETPRYEMPLQKTPRNNATQRSESLFYHNFTTSDLYATRSQNQPPPGREQFQNAYL